MYILFALWSRDNRKLFRLNCYFPQQEFISNISWVIWGLIQSRWRNEDKMLRKKGFLMTSPHRRSSCCVFLNRDSPYGLLYIYRWLFLSFKETSGLDFTWCDNSIFSAVTDRLKKAKTWRKDLRLYFWFIFISNKAASFHTDVRCKHIFNSLQRLSLLKM